MFDLEQLQVLLENLPDPAFVITRSGYYVAAFGGKDVRFYHSGSGLVGLKASDFMAPKQANWLKSEVGKALTSHTLHIVQYPMSGTDIGALDGEGPTEPLWFEARIQPLPFQVKGEDAVMWIASNITERHKLEEKLRGLSETDPLTGIMNRRKFEIIASERLKSMQAEGPYLSFAMIDIDHFKQINDRFGHMVGDKVIGNVASAVAASLRKNDLIARWGGEEYVLMLTTQRHEQAAVVVERVRKGIEAMVFDHAEKVTISAGISHCTTRDRNLDTYLAAADEALYRAKRTGRNRVCVASQGKT
jgi:diguanylate cyclase (GGDEF)-like protein